MLLPSENYDKEAIMQTALSSIYAGMNRISNIICKILEVIIVLVVVCLLYTSETVCRRDCLFKKASDIPRRQRCGVGAAMAEGLPPPT